MSKGLWSFCHVITQQPQSMNWESLTRHWIWISHLHATDCLTMGINICCLKLLSLCLSPFFPGCFAKYDNVWLYVAQPTQPSTAIFFYSFHSITGTMTCTCYELIMIDSSKTPKLSHQWKLRWSYSVPSVTVLGHDISAVLSLWSHIGKAYTGTSYCS